MQIIQELLNSIQQDAPITQVQIGVHWCVVHSRFCGMASTVPSTKPHGETGVRDAGQLHSMSAKELAAFTLSDNTLEASVGLAALNSLIEIPGGKIAKVNAFQFLAEKGAGKTIAVFGHFPNTRDLRASAKEVITFELNPGEHEHDLYEVPTLLPDADLVAITSNSIINHTLADILPYIRKGAFTLLLGPSTPLSNVLFDWGIDVLAGVRVTDSQALFTSISQGAIFRQIRGVELITLSR